MFNVPHQPRNDSVTPATDDTSRHPLIRSLLNDYIQMYAGRDPRLVGRFSQNFSGYTGGGDCLVKDVRVWQDITRQDFAQIPDAIRIEMRDVQLQDLSPEVVVATAFFHIHLPIPEHVLAQEVARLVLIFRQESGQWQIVHSGISIPYPSVKDGEVYPIENLREQNQALEALVAERSQALRDSEALYRLLTEDTRDVLWKADRHLVVTYISPADERLRGFTASEVVGHHVFEFFTAAGVEQVKAVLQASQQARAEGKLSAYVSFEAPHRCKGGSEIWGEVVSRAEVDAHGQVVGYHGITREITRRRLLEQQVHQLAFFDPLTQLANRRLLDDRLAQVLAASKRSACQGALMFLDLDNFKPLNDLHGHAVGDLLLVEVASRLQACVRHVDTVSRFGGDEFVVLLGELSANAAESAQQALAVAEKIRQRLAEPYALAVAKEDGAVQTVVHHCTASGGLVVFSGHDAIQSEVMAAADAAMYQAKAAGRNRVCMEVGANQSDGQRG